MTIRKKDGRRLIQLSVQPELFELIKAHCDNLDIPVTIWARELMRREVATPTSTHTP